MKQRIRLTESYLHRIIKESVKEVINELDVNTWHNAAEKDYMTDRRAKFRQKRNREFNRLYSYDDGKRNQIYLIDTNELYVHLDNGELYTKALGEKYFEGPKHRKYEFPNVNGNKRLARALSKAVAAFDNICDKDKTHQPENFHKYLGKE